jgi:hypothetical protein
LYEAKKSSNSLDEKAEEDFRQHQERKTEARIEKDKDKARAKSDKSTHVETFDLQAVLTTPCSLVGELYYKRKLCVYNLSTYSLKDGNTTCYVWEETQAKRGSCEIATCLLKQTTATCTSKPHVKEITYYSDTCGGQNRNQFVAASLHYSLTQNKTLEVINHKFFERGHSQMENDSVHAAIETAKKKTQVFVPSQWHTVIVLARKKNPYIVVPVKFGDVYNFKEYAKNVYPNMKMDVKGQKIKWLSIRWVQVRQTEPKSIFINYTFDPTEFHQINIQTANRQRGRPQAALHALYSSKQPISEAKKKDLVSLCRSGIIPEDFHQYYESLATSKHIRDKLPSPDAEEKSDNED